ncbi:MAG: cobalamin-binding protein [Candidatus Omnitrophica bacterium]|jgi:iron complex transport system substrate-binding protein|nr:cobalamin-binding protein [Candidatus Omnitrophota bacterium]MDD5691494.1 cobalamin-binding protein [Candidatus Omnitrophota bacterium]
MKKIIFISIFICLSFCYAAAGKPRYISLAPSTTEILFALGLDNEIAGVSTYCNYPEQTRNKTKVGSFSSPSIEKIISLSPDYIFCTGLEQAPVIAQLRQLNFNVYVADPVNAKELFKTIEEIGQITHKIKEASLLIEKMESEIEEVVSKVKLIPQEERIKVFIEIWHEPLMTAAKGSFVDELITLAGGVNIAHDLIRPYCNFSAEKVISLNPQCIILAYMDSQAPLKLVQQRFGWNKIDAVKNGRVFNDIDPDTLLRPGPRITRGLIEVYKRLYPGK